MSSYSSSPRTTITLPGSPSVSPTSSNQSCINSPRRPHKAWYCRHDNLPQFLAEHANAKTGVGSEIQQFLQAGISNQILINSGEEVNEDSEIAFVVRVDVTEQPNERGHKRERICHFASVGDGDFYEISPQIWRRFHPKIALLDQYEFYCAEHAVSILIRTF